jgi:cellulose synthase/poly-beta-1,6-N-acetylglucosamine synthase-like glycosyltransferase
MRVIAILATYNEERFIANCLEHLFRQGVEVYLMDNDSEDETVAIARRSGCWATSSACRPSVDLQQIETMPSP